MVWVKYNSRPVSIGEHIFSLDDVVVFFQMSRSLQAIRILVCYREARSCYQLWY